MKSFLKYVRCAAVLTVLMLVVCGLAYPAALTGLGQAFFAHQANGSLITAEGEKTTDPVYKGRERGRFVFRCGIRRIKSGPFK